MPISHSSLLSSTPASIRSLWLSALAMLLALALSSAAFFAPTHFLPWLAGIELVLLVHGMLNQGKISGLVRYIVLQLLFTIVLYLAIHGGNKVSEGVLAVARIFLAIVPGWWLTNTVSTEAIGAILGKMMPNKWAFVVVASINLLPYMVNEVREIYQLQRLRGARIAPKQLLNPRSWGEFSYCVIFPLLIQLLKLARQIAVAAKARHFGYHAKRTLWPSQRSEHDN
ncbi:energy-coupling factor transporter transmembrane protein EcfT [Shewanella sp. A3A]|nr:energy-coupling factor transporter transmembrane protein EcfT [Shewanella ferrihydritica]